MFSFLSKPKNTAPVETELTVSEDGYTCDMTQVLDPNKGQSSYFVIISIKDEMVYSYNFTNKSKKVLTPERVYTELRNWKELFDPQEAVEI